MAWDRIGRVGALRVAGPALGVLAALASLYHAVSDADPYRDVLGYRSWILGPLPSWDVPGPYPVVGSLTWWPLRWFDVGQVNRVWILGVTLPATVVVVHLVRRHAARPAAATTVLLIATAVLERNWWLRMEPIAAALGVLGLYALRRAHPGRAGLALGVGGLVKVWPMFLLPMALVLTPARSWWRLLVAAAVPWLALACAGAVLRPDHAWTWLTFALTRRVQVESFAALVPLTMVAAGSHLWHTVYRAGADHATLVVGPHVRFAQAVVSRASYVGLAVTGVRIGWWWRRSDSRRRTTTPDGGREPLTVAACGQIVVLVLLTAAAPVLSPQYLAWFLPVLVVAAGEGLLLGETVVWIVACVLTTVEFPFLYQDVVEPAWPGIVVLAARDLTLVVLLLLAARHLWRATVRGAPASPGDRGGPVDVPPVSDLPARVDP